MKTNKAISRVAGHTGYGHAVKGTAPGPAKVDLDRLGAIVGFGPEVGRALRVLKESIILTRNGESAITPDQMCEVCMHELGIPVYAGGDANWHCILSIALALAKEDTRYWGITDPEAYHYCTKCREAKPIAEFPSREDLCCFSCIEKRERRKRAKV